MKHFIAIPILMAAVISLPGLSPAADSPEGASAETHQQMTGSPLDSRAIARPEWTQVSGEVEEQAKTALQEGESPRLIVTLKTVEGATIKADLGDASQLGNVELQTRDYIHVRGPMARQGLTQVLVAGELIADGKVFRIDRQDWNASQRLFQDDRGGTKESATPLSPAAPEGKQDKNPSH
ncbi:MAG: hypothetical protein NW701_13525 [Nitrospira sp.]